MDTDAMFDAAFAASEAQPQADATTPENVPTQEEATQEKPTEEAAETEESGSDPKEEAFPKKAVNAISRRDKQIGKLRAQYEAAQAELNKFREQSLPKPTQQTNSGEPKETDFNNYADYLEARATYKIEQKFAERESKQQESLRSSQEQNWLAERNQYVSTKAQEFIKEVPDALSIVQEYGDIADEFSPELQRLFLEADNAPLAFYNLAKEGKLEALMAMSPAKAAMEIGMAQAIAPSKPKTKAPAPLPASRGNAASQKPPEKWTADDAVNWLNS